MELLPDEFGPKNTNFKYFDNLRIKQERSRGSSQQSGRSSCRRKSPSLGGACEESSLFQSTLGKPTGQVAQMHTESPKFGGGKEISCILLQEEPSTSKVVRHFQSNTSFNLSQDMKLNSLQAREREKSQQRKQRFKDNQEKARKAREKDKLDQKIRRELKEQRDYQAGLQQQLPLPSRSRKYSPPPPPSQRNTILINYADNHYPKFIKNYYGFIPLKHLLRLKTHKIQQAKQHYHKTLMAKYFLQFMSRFRTNLMDFQIKNRQQDFKVHTHHYQQLIPKYFFFLWANYDQKQKQFNKYRDFANRRLLHKVFTSIRLSKRLPAATPSKSKVRRQVPISSVNRKVMSKA